MTCNVFPKEIFVVVYLLLSFPIALQAAMQPPPLARPSAGLQQATQGPTQLTLEQRADIFMARKNYADAVELYLRALKQASFADAVLWNKVGIAYQQQMDFRAAEKAYKRATRLQDDFAEPWNNLGTIYYLRNKYRRSVQYYQRAIQLKPNAASFHLNLGTSYYHLKKVGEVLEEYRVALALDPNCLTAHSSTGTVVQARGADAEFYFYLAKVFASIGRAEDAVRYLRRAFEDGLKDHRRLEKDPDFQKISDVPAYVELLKNPPFAIKD